MLSFDTTREKQIDDYQISPPKTHNQIRKAAKEKQDKLSKPVIETKKKTKKQDKGSGKIKNATTMKEPRKEGNTTLIILK